MVLLPVLSGGTVMGGGAQRHGGELLPGAWARDGDWQGRIWHGRDKDVLVRGVDNGGARAVAF